LQKAGPKACGERLHDFAESAGVGRRALCGRRDPFPAEMGKAESITIPTGASHTNAGRQCRALSLLAAAHRCDTNTKQRQKMDGNMVRSQSMSDSEYLWLAPARNPPRHM
jgi:hypothetical protein